ncbi:MAG TPA: tRNA (adenosine(37)-N6)-dimethylallyltransferase MiaA [Clostridiales bacterium]|nr:tRNA (adenosine(37)-N6)-dimethylallyltransferase MiaA [Clostridiales bacterium]
MVQKNSLIVIGGPTAVGKSALGLELAKKHDGEIVSADSMQIYRGMDIGTAKPTLDERKAVKHHMIDILDINDEYSAEQYKDDADIVIIDILKRNKLPIVLGGTGFYIKALLFEHNFGYAPKNQEIRDKYNNILNKFGKEYLHDLLKQKDFESAKKIHPNDTKKVIRALEIFEVSGQKKSTLAQKEQKKRYNFKMFILCCDRAKLYERINKRAEEMIKNGLIDEVKTLIKNGANINSQAMQGIGYKETVEYLKNQITKYELIELIKMRTRNYAKRQITYFKGIKEAIWIDIHNTLPDIVL